MNIVEICNDLLDNADVTLDLSNYPKVVLNFIVAGIVDSKYWEVQFNLDSVFELSITTEHDEEATANDCYVVLKTVVKSENINGNEIHSISLESGGFEFFSKTCGFSYSASSFERSQFVKKYPYFFI